MVLGNTDNMKLINHRESGIAEKMNFGKQGKTGGGTAAVVLDSGKINIEKRRIIVCVPG